MAELAEPFDVAVSLYGSTVRSGRLVGDLDVWIAGDASEVAWACEAIRTFEDECEARIDVAAAVQSVPAKPIDDAVRWCVHHEGIVIAGSRPAPPSRLTGREVDAIFRAAAVARAGQISRHAEALARAGSRSAVLFVDAGLHALLRAIATDHAEARRLRRLPTKSLVARIRFHDRLLGELLREPNWPVLPVATRLATVAAAL